MSWLTDHLFSGIKSKDDTDQTSNSAAADEEDMQNQITNTTNQAESDSNEKNEYDKREIAAEWNVPLRGNLHLIEFEHGTTSGKRVLWIDGKVNAIAIISSIKDSRFFSFSLRFY